MKKLILILLFFIILIAGCQSYQAKDEIIGQKSAKTLTDMQITACNAAHEAGTCNTRLQELGIILKEDCCQILGKCC